MKYKSIPTAILEKINIWQSKNEAFKQALVDNNANVVQSLLEDGYPFYLQNILTDDEISQIGDVYYDDLTDDFYNNLSESIEAVYLSQDKIDLFELLANYLMYQNHDISFRFRRNYFCYTQNYENGLEYAEKLMNEFGFLKAERSSWLLGALYNENNQFFDSFYELYKKNEDAGGLFALKGKILKDGKYYNVESWKKHYKYYFPTLVEKKFRANEENDINVFSVIILDLIKYPLEQYENGTKENKLKVKPIIDFLQEDFSSISITDLPNLEYMMISILFEKERELLWELGLKDKKSANTVNLRTGVVSGNLKNLYLDSALKRNTEKLNHYILKSISQNNPVQCFDAFVKIGLPKDRYKVLEQYVEISQISKSQHCFVKNKKINKV